MATTPEEGIRRTLVQYAQLCDDGRFVEWAELFTTDARFHVMGRTREGRHAVRTWIEAAQPPQARGRHAVSAPIVDLGADRRTALAWSDYLFFSRTGTMTSAGRYHDELVQADDGRWRFSLREIVFQGDAPQLTQPPPG